MLAVLPVMPHQDIISMKLGDANHFVGIILILLKSSDQYSSIRYR
jgi:hypothetical protein